MWVSNVSVSVPCLLTPSSRFSLCPHSWFHYTYLYIDKQMRDHGLFQAICRVNRLDGDDKEYGYVVDYKDLFKSLDRAVTDYTSGALDGFDREDVAGLLQDRGR